jgi:hypothetical protein
MVLSSLFSNGSYYIIYLTEISHNIIIRLHLFVNEQVNLGNPTMKKVGGSMVLMGMALS